MKKDAEEINRIAGELGWSEEQEKTASGGPATTNMAEEVIPLNEKEMAEF